MHKDDDWSTYMLDIWVENIKTKECWRYDDDPAKDVYQCGGIPFYKNDMSMYRFYPCCPKKAPTMKLPKVDLHQMTIFDYEDEKE